MNSPKRTRQPLNNGPEVHKLHQKGKKIGQLPRAKPILVAMKVKFSIVGEDKALCDTLASEALNIDGELS